jgi:hypothetical protein
MRDKIENITGRLYTTTIYGEKRKNEVKQKQKPMHSL